MTTPPKKTKPSMRKKKRNEDLFEKLAQPQVKSKAANKKKAAKIEENFDGYNVHERDNLDRLIENSLD